MMLFLLIHHCHKGHPQQQQVLLSIISWHPHGREFCVSMEPASWLQLYLFDGALVASSCKFCFALV